MGDPFRRPSFDTHGITQPTYPLYIYIYGGVFLGGGFWDSRGGVSEGFLGSVASGRSLDCLIPGFRHAHTLHQPKNVVGHSPPGECLDYKRNKNNNNQNDNNDHMNKDSEED